jgi:hypothetical protein
MVQRSSAGSSAKYAVERYSLQVIWNATCPQVTLLDRHILLSTITYMLPAYDHWYQWCRHSACARLSLPRYIVCSGAPNRRMGFAKCSS